MGRVIKQILSGSVLYAEIQRDGNFSPVMQKAKYHFCITGECKQRATDQRCSYACFKVTKAAKAFADGRLVTLFLLKLA